MATQKNNAIEFYKYVAACIIFCLHARGRYGNFETNTGAFYAGYLAVEFFFIISGYMMMQSIERKQLSDNSEVSAVQYLISRYMRLYPHYIIAILLLVIVNAFFLHGFKHPGFYLECFPEFFALQVFWSPNTIYTPLWFVSALIWASFPAYYLILKRRDFSIYILFPLAFLLFLGVAYESAGTVDIIPGKVAPFLSYFRAFAEIGWGAVLYVFTSKVKNSVEKFPTLFLGVIEVLLFAAMVYIMFFRRRDYMDFVCVFIVSALIVLAACKCGAFNKALDNRFSGLLGGGSYSMYTIHIIVIVFIKFLFPEYPYWPKTIIGIVVTTILAFAYERAIQNGISFMKNAMTKRMS